MVDVIDIVELTPPMGSVKTHMYGLTQDGGYVHIRERMGWVKVKHMRGSEVLPRRNSEVYLEHLQDVELFSMTPSELDDVLPYYISIPDEYTELEPAVDEAMHAVWHGTSWERKHEGIDMYNDLNASRFFATMESVSDEVWEEYTQAKTIVEAVAEGWETESVARTIVGDELYDSINSDSQETSDSFKIIQERLEDG